MTLYFDGGLRPGPGGMETAVVVGGEVHLRDDLGPGDSCTAEWLALLAAADLARAAGADDALFLGDSRTVVEQALGRWRCRNAAMQPHLAAFRAATAGIGRVHLRYVPRAKNLAGIALARRHPR